MLVSIKFGFWGTPRKGWKLAGIEICHSFEGVTQQTVSKSVLSLPNLVHLWSRVIPQVLSPCDEWNGSGNGTIRNLIDTNGLERAEKIQFTMLVNGSISSDSFDECVCGTTKC